MLNMFYRRLKDQRGGIFLTTLIITGLIALGTSLYSLGEKAEKTMRERVDVTKYADIDISVSGDPNQDHENNTAGFVSVAIEGGKTAAGLYDDTAVLILLDKSGILDIENKDNASDVEDIIESLKSSNLPTDPLSVGIAEMVKKKVELNSNFETTPEEIDSRIIEIIQDMKENEIQFDSGRDTSGDINSIIDLDFLVRDTLEINGNLADEEAVDLKKELERNYLSHKYNKEILEKYKALEDMGFIITDTTDIAEAERRLADINNKIEELSSKIQEQEQRMLTEEEKIEETAGEEAVLEEEISEEEETIITLNGTVGPGPYITGFNAKIIIIINLDTGIVSGNIKGTGFGEFEGITYSDPIYGNMNLETREINALCNITVSGVPDSDRATFIPTSITGTLSEDTVTARGSASTGADWNTSR